MTAEPFNGHLPDILAKIVADKREAVARFKTSVSLDELKAKALAQSPTLSLAQALRTDPGEGAKVRVIAEVKKASPSAGLLAEDFDPVWLAKEYQAGGAAAISVLTEEFFFQGGLFHLSAVKAVVDLPVLMKDFILDEVQIYQGRISGADAVLLIVAILEPARLVELSQVAACLGLDTLVEIHDEKDLNQALAAGAKIIGINNRDLRTFQVDLATSERLAKLIPADKIIVSASGIASTQDIKRLKKAGLSSFLIGTALLKSPSPGQKLVELLAGQEKI